MVRMKPLQRPWCGYLVRLVGSGVVAFGSTTSARADSDADHLVTVQSLLNECTSNNNTIKGICVGYVSAVMDVMEIVGAAGISRKDDAMQPFGMCNKEFVSHGAAIQAFTNWAESHPEQWNQRMDVGVMSALRELWPCLSPSQR